MIVGRSGRFLQGLLAAGWCLLAGFGVSSAGASGSSAAIDPTDFGPGVPALRLPLSGDWNGDGTDTLGIYSPATGAFFLKNSSTTGPENVWFQYGGGGGFYTAIAGDWNNDGTDTVGLYNPATGNFFLRNSNSAGAADIVFAFGAGGNAFLPLAGDWNNDGVDTIGLYDPGTGNFFLKNTNTPGAADLTFAFGGGGPNFVPIAGDWNGDGTDTIGIYTSATGVFLLRNSNTPGAADLTFTFGAGGGLVPVIGDWNGDGVDTIGLYDASTGTFFLRNTNSGGSADLTFDFGPAGLFRDGFEVGTASGWSLAIGDDTPLPLSGDWDGNLSQTVGLYDPVNGFFFLRNSNSAGNPDLTFQFGAAGSGLQPVAGDWNNDGTDTIGLYSPPTGAFFLRNSNSAGPPDLQFNFGAGGLGLVPLVGDWNGDGTDTIGLYDASTGAFLLRNSNTAGAPDVQFVFGPPGLGFLPLRGDFDNDGTDTVGFVDPWAASWWLKNSNSTGRPDLVFAFGTTGCTPLAGNWDGFLVEGGDGSGTPGTYEAGPHRWSLRNSNSGGSPDIVFSFPISPSPRRRAGAVLDSPAMGAKPAASAAPVPARYRFGVYHLALLAAVAAVWVWAAIDPVFRDDWWLENVLVFIGVPLVVGLGFYFRLSNLSYTLIALFTILHIIGSHYTYALVPFGDTLQRWLGAERNMYDRLVHFAFGFLLAYPVREIFVRITQARGVWSFYLPIELTLAFSAIYELIEWAAASGVAPEAGLAFLGAQGDVWDAQKDMAAAGLGSVIAMTITFFIVLRIAPGVTRELRDSLRIPAGDRPIGEDQIADWLRGRRNR